MRFIEHKYGSYRAMSTYDDEYLEEVFKHLRGFGGHIVQNLDPASIIEFPSSAYHSLVTLLVMRKIPFHDMTLLNQ